MNSSRDARCPAPLLCALLAFGVPLPIAAQETYLDDIAHYLMDVEAEVELARSAAPHGLGEDADVWVLESDGYRQVATGSNGFACFVGRGWSGPVLVGPVGNRRLHPDVFDHDLRAPHCFNPAAAESILPWQLARTEALLDGVAAEALDRTLNARIGRDLALPAPGAMAYMMSPGQDLGPDFGAWRPHVMVYIPDLDNGDWGIPGFTHDFPFVAESGGPWAVAVLPMRRYSDGSWASQEVDGRHAHGGFAPEVP